jgi:hypothetical protein
MPKDPSESQGSTDEASQTEIEIAVHIIGKGWVRKLFKSQAAADEWIDAHEADFDEIRWAN